MRLEKLGEILVGRKKAQCGTNYLEMAWASFHM